MLLKIIREILSNIINNIDSGNSNITDNDAVEIIKTLRSYTDKTQKLSKYQACQYLNVSRASFDNYVREGLLPKGSKESGFKELFWQVKDLDNFIKSRSNGNKKKV